MIRMTRIRYGFWRFLSYTAVLRFDTDFSKYCGDIIFNHIMPYMHHRTILHNGVIVCYAVYNTFYFFYMLVISKVIPLFVLRKKAIYGISRVATLYCTVGNLDNFGRLRFFC